MKALESRLQKILKEALEEIKSASSLDSMEAVRIKFLGRKSELTEVLRSLKEIDKDERAKLGKLSNEIKLQIESGFENKKRDIEKKQIEEKIKEEWIDVTLPSSELEIGYEHPIPKMIQFACDIFTRMGFEIYYPNEVDSEFHNFTAVNIPEGHPARDMWDTFWTTDGNVAITHTSSMQHRVLKTHIPPIRAVVPGKCFRNEATDSRHEHTFYQLEGMYVDKGINLSHMLGTIKEFFSNFFETEMDILFTPDFFPFVEPGGMISISTKNLKGNFERVTKGTGWLEVLGCGMIHPNVLKLAGIDPEVYSGFAWGVGIERLIMLKYDIDDIRLFHSGDLRFIHQFK